MRAQLSFILSQITRLTDERTDRRTDGRKEFLSLDRVCILRHCFNQDTHHFSVFERHAELAKSKRVYWENWVALKRCRFCRDALETVINSRKLPDAVANPSTQRKR